MAKADQNKNTVILLCADENVNRGERDYAIAIGLQLSDQSNTDVASYKIGEKRPVSGVTAHLALNNNDYEKIPPFDRDAIMQHIKKAKGNIRIIGAGESTYVALNAIHDAAESQGLQAKCSLISHMITPDKEDSLAQTDIQVFTTASPRELTKLDATGNLQPIPAVPHTATDENLAYHAHLMAKKSDNGTAINAVVNAGKPFAAVILNAGFDVDGQYMPYTAAEARTHGHALGQYLDDNTALILVDGGPRNVKDRELGELTDQAFIDGYIQGQQARNATNTPRIIHEAFKPGMAYNSLYGMLHHAQKDNCTAVISNAEGYGTMDAVIQFIDNKSKLSGMFPFAANEYVQQRLENISQYNQAGIACLFSQSGDLVIRRHDNEQATPTIKQENPVSIILKTLGLENNTSNTAPKLLQHQKFKPLSQQ